MVKKRTKIKATKKTVRKKVVKTARARRPTAKVAKTPRTPSSTTAAPERDVAATGESSRAIDLLRSWSPSRYSHR